MGKRSQQFFEREALTESCFIFPGSTKQNIVDRILSQFDSISFHQHTHFERVIAKKGNHEYVIILQAYGAPTIIDLLAVLKDGGIQNIYFIGSAFCFDESIDVGDILVPRDVQALDGILPFLEGENYSAPDPDLLESLKGILSKNSIHFTECKTVSVPSVTAQPKSQFIDKDVVGLEMECASFLHFSQKRGMKAVALLVISDTKHKKLIDNNGDYKQKMVEILSYFI